MRRVQRIAGGAVAVYLLLVLLDRFVLVELLVRRTGLAVLVALVEAVAVLGAGVALRGALGGGRRSDLPRDFLLGYPVFGTVCFLIGTINVSAASMTIALVVFGVLGACSVIPSRADGEESPANGGAGARKRGILRFARNDTFAIVATVVFGCALVTALAPPTSLDELAYHLAVPWTWVTEHRAIELPLLSHSYFPLGIESADLPLLAILGQLSGGIASHVLHLIAAVVTTLALRRLAHGGGFVVAAIVATPALAVIAGWSLVEWPLLGICAVLMLALDDGDDATLAAALAAGLLTKYTFVPFAVIAVVRRWRSRAVLIGLAAGSIFFVRNLILTANPIAPFLSAAAPHVAGYRAPYLSDYVFDGRYLDESLGASLLALCVMAAGSLSWIVAGIGVVLFLLAPSSRILIPYFAIPAARGEPSNRFLRVVVGMAIVVQLFLVAFYVHRGDAFALLSGQLSDGEYLTKQRASYAAAQTIDAQLPPDARVLVVGLNETFWFAHRVRGGGNFDGPRLSQYLEAPAPEALRERLRRDGITHVAIVSAAAPTAVAQKAAERETALSPDAQRTLSRMLDHYAAGVSSRGATTLFTLR